MKKLFNYLNRSLQTGIFMLLFIQLSRITTVSAQSGIETGIKIFDNRNYYGAEKFFTDFLKNDPGNATAYYYLGRIAWINNKNDDASGYFEKATDLDESNTWFYTWKGINYITIIQQVDFIQQGLYAFKAMSALEKAVDLDSLNVLARIYLAGYYANAPGFAGGSRENAIRQINAAVAISPSDIGANLQRGIIMAGFKEYAEAKKSFETVINFDPESYTAWFQLGKMCSEAGEYLEQGEVSLTRFIDTAPEEFDSDKDDAWWFLGNIYLKKGNNAMAKKAYEKAIKLNPDNEDYRKSLKNVM